MEDDPNVPAQFYTFFNQGEMITGALDNSHGSCPDGWCFCHFDSVCVFAQSLDDHSDCCLHSIHAGCRRIRHVFDGRIAQHLVVDGFDDRCGNGGRQCHRCRRSHLCAPYHRVKTLVLPPSKALQKLSLAISLSTLTTLAVFLPVILMNQNTDYAFFLGEIGFPISWALGASLLAALAFTLLTTTVLKAKKGQKLQEASWMLWVKRQSIEGALGWVLRRRMDAMMGIISFLVVTYAFPFKTIGCMGEDDGGFGDFSIRYTIPPQYGYYDRVKDRGYSRSLCSRAP